MRYVKAPFCSPLTSTHSASDSGSGSLVADLEDLLLRFRVR